MHENSSISGRLSHKHAHGPKYQTVQRLIAAGLTDGQIIDRFEREGRSITQTYVRSLRRQGSQRFVDPSLPEPIRSIALAVQFVRRCGGVESARKTLSELATAKACIGLAG